MPPLRADEYWQRLKIDLNIIDIGRVGELLDQGRLEEARDHFISCARAAWQYRWLSVRHFTLKRLGEALDAERFPELRGIADALMAEAPGAAKQFLDHLRQRRKPDCSSYIHSPSAPAADFDPEAAASFALWQAWAATRDERFKHHLARRIAQYLDPLHVISWHETFSSWGMLVMSTVHHGGIDDETLCKLILFGLDHAEQCNVTSHLSEPPQPSIGGNHLFAWLGGWLTATILFPEFRRSPALQFAAIARLDDELSKQVMPDGSMIEGAPGYQNCCIYGASVFLRMCAEQGIELPQTTRDAWEKMMRFCIGLVRPDGRLPMFGDSQDDRTYAAPMRKFYQIPELDWLTTEGKEGHPPSYTSKDFPCIGYYVQRTGWRRDDLWLCFDGGRFGQAHHHEDKLNFELDAYGRTMIVDAGVRSYSDHWFRTWSVLAQAHNVLLIDGVGQCRWRQDRDLWFSPIPLKNRWETGPEWDIAEADFTGPYEREIGPIVQRRRIVFHRTQPAFWWITDTLEGPGEHEVTELFHFAHDIETVTTLNDGVRTRLPGGPDLAILCLFSGEPLGKEQRKAKVEMLRGEQDPPRGWVSPKLHEVAPAWEVHFTGRARLPLRRDFILLPWRTALPEELSARLSLSGAPRVDLTVGAERHSVQLPLA